MKFSVDYLIVGGGIAGLSLAHYLEKEQEDFIIVNQNLPGAATKVSAGIINPVTGQRFVFSWKYEELKSEFLLFYHALEEKFNQKFIDEIQQIQVLESADEQNAWLARSADPLYKPYFSEDVADVSSHFYLSHKSLTAVLKSLYLIRTDSLLTQLERYFIQAGKYECTAFDYSDLVRNKFQLSWKGIEIRKAIVFAEGFRIASNPFFNWLPVVPLKGECLHVEIPDLNHFHSIFKSDYALVPLLEENVFWCGSNFYLQETELNVTENEKRNQLEFIQKNLRHPFQLKGHFFGIRPASRDRRPIIGAHPSDPRLIVFNGLGTKGLSLAPYCSQFLLNWLVREQPIPSDLGIHRFLAKGIIPPAI